MKWNTETAWWTVLTAAVLLLGVWWIPGSGGATDSYSTALAGKRLLAETLQAAGFTVRRSETQLIPTTDRSGHFRLLILGPARVPSVPEQQRLDQKVNAGAGILIAAPPTPVDIELKTFGVRIVVPNPPDAGFAQSQMPAHGIAAAQASNIAAADSSETLLQPPYRAQAAFETKARLTFDGTRTWEHLIVDGGRVLAARTRNGRGALIVVASDEVFSNSAMLNADRAAVAHQLITSLPDVGDIWIDESLNRSGPKKLGILFDPLFRPLTLQLLLLLVLFGWGGSVRFGAAEVRRDNRRRSIVEHAEGLGDLYLRSRDGHWAIRCAWEHFQLELRRLCGASLNAKDAHAVARRTRMSVPDVQAVISEVDGVLQSGQVSVYRAGRILRRIAELNRRLHLPDDPD